MLSRSPTVDLSATGSEVFSAGTDSPVSAASSVRRFFASASRRSAGTLSPDSSNTMSPGTRSSAGVMRVSPPRTVRASAESMLRIESSAFSALPSWMKPSSAFRITTPKMIPASSHRPEHQLHEPGAEQHVDEDVVELGEEAHERPALLAFGQAVRPVLLQAGLRFARVEPLVDAGGKPLHHVCGRQGVPKRIVAGLRGFSCYIHLFAPLLSRVRLADE